MDMMLMLLTGFSALVALVMTVIAWRSTREERRRSEARVAALAEAIHGSPRGTAPADLPLHFDSDPAPGGELFTQTQAHTTRSRSGLVLAAGALVVGAAAALVVAAGSSTKVVSGSGAVKEAAQTQRAPAPAALELVALAHEADADRITVRGVVRNPAMGPVHGVVAVVLLFDRDGGFVATARAGVEAEEISPGAESAFAVTVPAADIGKYRVSFRIDDRVLPHIDARKL